VARLPPTLAAITIAGIVILAASGVVWWSYHQTRGGGGGMPSTVCPTLPLTTTPEPQGWVKVSAPAWTTNGTPTAFFLGSVACPYCSSSSWAVYLALAAFGTVSGPTFSHSNPTDTPSNIPGVLLANLTVRSPYVSFLALEGTLDSAITVPPPASCAEGSYESDFDTGGSIPFLVINGQYFHVGTLVNPTELAGYSPQQIWGQLLNQTGPVWELISPAIYMIEALLVKANGGLPASVADDPNVAALLPQIT